MLNYVLKSTYAFLESKGKLERKKIGQFFTSKETAIYMASLVSIIEKERLTVLDPGAGSGILIAALIDRLQIINTVKELNVTCYENNDEILNLLWSNMEYLKDNSKLKIEFRIIRDNYILSQKDNFNRQDIALGYDRGGKYDVVIGNPPYLKIAKDAPEALAMPNVCYGAPNLYFLFASMSVFNLTNNGELVYIIPRSWTSGAYFKKFREYIFKNARLTNIHLFVSRDKVFDNEQVLQEVVIVKMIKTQKKIKNVIITSSVSNLDFKNSHNILAPYSTVISGSNMYVYLVTTQDQIQTLKRLNELDYTLEDLGLKMRTGLTVDFRNKELLRTTPNNNAIPLFYSQHIKNGQIEFPIGKEYEYMIDTRVGVIQKNKNYLFIKRFTTKEEKRRLQCGVYLAEKFSKYQNISTQNKINFIDTTDKSSMCENLVYGLYTIYNSSSYDLYYRILNGSTQVNSTEINTMPMPSKKMLLTIGKKIKEKQCMSVETCDELLEEFLYEKNRRS